MADFVKFWIIYQDISRTWAAKKVYSHTKASFKVLLYLAVMSFIGFSAISFLCEPYAVLLMAAVISSAVLFAVVWELSVRSFFDSYDKENSLACRYFKKDYNFMRYLEFKDRVSKNKKCCDVNSALRAIECINSTKEEGVLSHPFIVVMTAVFVALIGAAVATWSAQLVAYSIVFFLIAFSLCSFVIGVVPNDRKRLLEFQRFLLWLDIDLVEP